MIYDFISIGAGISGLYTHYLLKQENPKFNILILESSNRIGGRIYKDGNSRLGAKFLHNNFLGIPLEIQETYYIGKLKNYNRQLTKSMKLEELGSLSTKIHPEFNFTNEINVSYDFYNLINNFNKSLPIILNTSFNQYQITDNCMVINNRFMTKCLIFAVPINILKKLNTPYQNLFKNWFQAKVITLSFELTTRYNILEKGFFFDKQFKKTSFFYDAPSNILYVNIFDTPKSVKLKKLITKLTHQYQLSNYVLKQQPWKTDKHYMGGWSIPKKTLSTEIIKLISGGYDNKIYYVGDYLGEISEIGTVTTAMKCVENLIKNLKISCFNL